MTGDMQLPDFEGIVASYPSGYDRIWKILWAVDPARLKRLEPDIRVSIAEIAINHQIAVTKTMGRLFQMEAEALEQLGGKLNILR